MGVRAVILIKNINKVNNFNDLLFIYHSFRAVFKLNSLILSDVKTQILRSIKIPYGL